MTTTRGSTRSGPGRDLRALRTIRRAVRLLPAFRDDVRGATAIEYGLMVAGLAVFVIGAITAAGTNINLVMGKVSNALH